MFKRLKLMVWANELMIFCIGLASLWPVFKSDGVLAQTPALPGIIEVVITAQAVEGTDNASPLSVDCPMATAYCQLPESQIDLFKYDEKKTCSLVSTINDGEAVSRKINVILTAYSSTPEETDSTPFVTANGSFVHDGVIANNMLPFGTKIRIPALYGNKVFYVEDRMHWRKSNYHFDVWMPSAKQAKEFGVKYAYVEVLK